MTKLMVAFSYFANALRRFDSSQNYGFARNIFILVSSAFSDDGIHTPVATVCKPGIPQSLVRRCSEDAGKQVCSSAAAEPVCR
jgi:hypothetical protein